MKTLTYYRVDIDKLEDDSLPDDTGKGFVDNTEVEYYDAYPSTWELSLQKERANIRYLEILKRINFITLIYDVIKFVKPNADQDTPPDTFSATFIFDRPEYLRTEDELNEGEFLEGADAIKRFIARALTTTINNNTAVFDPTGIDGTPSYAPYGFRIVDMVTGAAAEDIETAEAAITVTQIEFT